MSRPRARRPPCYTDPDPTVARASWLARLPPDRSCLEETLALRLMLTLLALATLGVPAPARATCPAPAPVTGQAVPSLAGLEGRIQAFMASRQLPGGAVAVSKDGRLVYARGFGYADTDSCEPVAPDALFRIASISKSFTAVAILKLVEQGLLGLDTKMTDVLTSLSPSDPRWHDITIAQLLWHSGGWDRDISGDPMFQTREAAIYFGEAPPGDCQTIIDYMQRPGVLLEHPPGTHYAYSNIGYCLLGRVIEAVTGQPYEAHIRNTILRPLGIEGMQIGHSLESQRLPGEVHYYDYPGAPLVQSVFSSAPSLVPNPYGGFYVEALDSGGGWVASAIDLVRFIHAADLRPWNPDLPQINTLISMLFAPPPPAVPCPATPPPAPPACSPYSAHEAPANLCSTGACSFHYGFAFDVYVLGGSPVGWGWGHGGMLPGTTTYVARMAEGTLTLPSGSLSLPAGVSVAAVFNSRPLAYQTLHPDLLAELARGIAEATSWPSGNLFPPLCGNGVLNLGEGCDDGNSSAGDGCSPECLLTAAAPVGTANFGFVETDPLTGQYCGNFSFEDQTYDVFGTSVNLGTSVGGMGFSGQAGAGTFATQASSVTPGLFDFESAGDLVCPAAGCDSGDTVSYVGGVTNLGGTVAGQLPNASYALEGGVEFTGATAAHACLPGSQTVWTFDGRFGVNAFRDIDVSTGGFARASSELRYYDSTTGSVRNLDVGVSFASVSSPGTLLVEGASNAAGAISADFALDLAGFRAFFFDVSTTAAYTGVVTVCVRYADVAPDDGVVDGTGVPEGALEILHREGTDFVKKTFNRFPVENLLCAQVDSLSPFALVVSLADSDGDGVADPDDACPRAADPGQADADGDGPGDACDNCTARANADQIDSDQDGYGNRCDADYNNDGAVSLSDFGLFRGQFGKLASSPGFEAAFDCNHDDAISLLDFGQFRQGFQQGAPGPSGLACAGTIPCSAP